MYDVSDDVKTDLRRALPKWVKRVSIRETLTPDGDSALVVFLVARAAAKELSNALSLNAATSAVQKVFDRHEMHVMPFVRFVSDTEPAP